jgi:serine/threonine-protein kinase
VYAAFDPMIERPVAIKVFRLAVNDPAAEAAVKDTFYREMQRIGVLIHPNIVTLYDAGELPGALFLASEFVDGASLADRLTESAAVDLPMRVAMLVQIVDALEYARAQGVAHLNLKPAAIYIASDGTLKLGGFGVAPVLDAIAAASGPAPSTSLYTAPERLRGGSGDVRSDVYALARIALDVLAASASRGDQGVPDLPPALADRGIDAARWRAVFTRALAANPAERYDSPLTLKFELVLLLGIDEADAHHSWETARSLGHLARLAGDSSSPRGEDAQTVLADPRLYRTGVAGAPAPPPDEDVDTGQMTVLAPSSDAPTTSGVRPATDTEAETATAIDERTRLSHLKPGI